MKTIAIAGKGGTGKSTLAALMIRWLNENRSKRILAVDADANVNLNDLLGVALPGTIGAIREEMKSMVSNLPGGMTKQQYLEYKIQSCLAETPEFDLLAMGRPEGPGCYCYANNLLRDILQTLGRNYDYIVIDNEAGLEHLSRRTTLQIDELLVISTAHVRGVHTAGRIGTLVDELQTRVKKRYLILNRVRGDLSAELRDCVAATGLPLLHCFPDYAELSELDQSTKALWPEMTRLAAWTSVGECMQKLGW
jgi:CO dehydrogenase maturation factor